MLNVPLGMGFFFNLLAESMFIKVVQTAARSKAYVCGRSPAEIVGSKPTGGMDVCCECSVLSRRVSAIITRNRGVLSTMVRRCV